MSSKAIDKGFAMIGPVKEVAKKISPAATEGSRLFPPKSRDHSCPIRFDAGRFDHNTKELEIHVQINSQASSPSLRDYAKKHSTHKNIATAKFNTAAADKDAETSRVLEKLREDSKKSVKR
ncbi:hypothetical protein MBLNU459_g5550t1 [Dothideomycetes sp. NU459]